MYPGRRIAPHRASYQPLHQSSSIALLKTSRQPSTINNDRATSLKERITEEAATAKILDGKFELSLAESQKPGNTKVPQITVKRSGKKRAYEEEEDLKDYEYYESGEYERDELPLYEFYENESSANLASLPFKELGITAYNNPSSTQVSTATPHMFANLSRSPEYVDNIPSSKRPSKKAKSKVREDKELRLEQLFDMPGFLESQKEFAALWKEEDIAGRLVEELDGSGEGLATLSLAQLRVVRDGVDAAKQFEDDDKLATALRGVTIRGHMDQWCDCMLLSTLSIEGNDANFTADHGSYDDCYDDTVFGESGEESDA